jgi:VPDSG-CTERM motif
MKTLPKKLLPVTLFGIAVTASLFSVRPAQAYNVTLERVGFDVVATGSGAINLTGLTFLFQGIATGIGIQPNQGIIQMGLNNASADVYSGFTGPTSFGSGGGFLANTSSGDLVSIFAGVFGRIGVPQGYVSGAALSNSMAFNNATFASLGVTPGTYVWTWGTGGNQNFTLQIGSVGVPGVPDGGSTVSLLGCALLGLAGLRRKLSC